MPAMVWLGAHAAPLVVRRDGPLLAGFTMFVANAAMPVMAIYLVSQDLDKHRFIGTGRGSS